MILTASWSVNDTPKADEKHLVMVSGDDINTVLQGIVPMTCADLRGASSSTFDAIYELPQRSRFVREECSPHLYWAVLTPSARRGSDGGTRGCQGHFEAEAACRFYRSEQPLLSSHPSRNDRG